MKRELPSKTYSFPGGLTYLERLVSARRIPLAESADFFQDDFDYDALKTETVHHIPALVGTPKHHITLKIDRLSQQLIGEPQLVFLHALTISVLRRDTPPPKAIDTFHTMWRDHGDFLMEHLDYRWLISAILTFGDHGINESQRLIGTSMGIFVNLAKLYESERLFCSFGPKVPFPTQQRQAKEIFLNQSNFAIFQHGDLDRNMLHHLWSLADKSDPVVRPIALAILEGFNADPRTVFRRVKLMRDRAAPKK